VEWHWPRDVRRHVVVPPGHCLLVLSPSRFAATIRDGKTALRRESSLQQTDGGHFTVILPPGNGASRDLALDMEVYQDGVVRRESARLIYPVAGDGPVVRTSFPVQEVVRKDLYAVATNGLGGMAQVRGAWGEIRSQYDALLAANLHESCPVDRQVLLTRCRAWLVREDYSQELTHDCLDMFSSSPGGPITWHFNVPAGRGHTVGLTAELDMADGQNAIALRFRRQESEQDEEDLDAAVPVRLIVRPDVEDRINHAKTQAASGAEGSWPHAVSARADGFAFSPSGQHRLDVRLSSGTFTAQPEWTYNVPHPVEADRGLGERSDLFSPGYFEADLAGGETITLHAAALERGEEAARRSLALHGPGRTHSNLPLEAETLSRQRGVSPSRPKSGVPFTGETAHAAIREFIVRRDDSRTIIAGYPWFLDWGRDTLICLRGVIAAGMTAEAEDILVQFARFERDGTLPNMIRGDDDSDRDTSDAPLWFFVACRDLVLRQGNREFLDRDCGGRPLSAVLRSIAESYARGTPNGIKMDPASGLVYSPSHFTWMDTNHPPGTPRQGYPIEIQALWHCALQFLATIDPDGEWSSLADKVRTSIHDLYPLSPSPLHSAIGNRQSAFLSDCLHAEPGQPAAQAEADDALRPNQLLAITLGAVDDPALCAGITRATSELLVPGGIRSLADRPVQRPIPVSNHGRMLNDPLNPYWGQYRQDEDTRRKPAYHNGTAWTWIFPSYSEALVMTYGEAARPAALSLLTAGERILDSGCVGHVPEIMDGDAPHAQRGCGAQAWGATELHRVLALLGGTP